MEDVINAVYDTENYFGSKEFVLHYYQLWKEGILDSISKFDNGESLAACQKLSKIKNEFTQFENDGLPIPETLLEIISHPPQPIHNPTRDTSSPSAFFNIIQSCQNCQRTLSTDQEEIRLERRYYTFSELASFHPAFSALLHEIKNLLQCPKVRNIIQQEEYCQNILNSEKSQLDIILSNLSPLSTDKDFSIQQQYNSIENEENEKPATMHEKAMNLSSIFHIPYTESMVLTKIKTQLNMLHDIMFQGKRTMSPSTEVVHNPTQPSVSAQILNLLISGDMDAEVYSPNSPDSMCENIDYSSLLLPFSREKRLITHSNCYPLRNSYHCPKHPVLNIPSRSRVSQNMVMHQRDERVGKWGELALGDTLAETSGGTLVGTRGESLREEGDSLGEIRGSSFEETRVETILGTGEYTVQDTKGDTLRGTRGDSLRDLQGDTRGESLGDMHGDTRGGTALGSIFESCDIKQDSGDLRQCARELLEVHHKLEERVKMGHDMAASEEPRMEDGERKNAEIGEFEKFSRDEATLNENMRQHGHEPGALSNGDMKVSSVRCYNERNSVSLKNSEEVHPPSNNGYGLPFSPDHNSISPFFPELQSQYRVCFIESSEQVSAPQPLIQPSTVPEESQRNGAKNQLLLPELPPILDYNGSESTRTAQAQLSEAYITYVVIEREASLYFEHVLLLHKEEKVFASYRLWKSIEKRLLFEIEDMKRKSSHPKYQALWWDNAQKAFDLLQSMRENESVVILLYKITVAEKGIQQIKTDVQSDPTWRFDKHQHHISYYKQDSDSGRTILLCEGELPARIIDIVTILNEADQHYSWVPYARKTEALYYVSRVTQIGFHEYHLPWPLENRIAFTFGFGVDMIDEDENCLIVVAHGIPEGVEQFLGHYDLPKYKNPHMDIKLFTFALYPGKDLSHTRVKILVSVDPQIAFVPPFILSAATKLLANGMFSKLYKQAKNFKNSVYEQRIHEKPNVYGFLYDRVDEAIANGKFKFSSSSS